MIDSWFVKSPGIVVLRIAQGLLLCGRRLLQTREVTLEQNRGGDPIDDAFPFPAPDIGGNQ
jgi:hypothetical protein